MFEIRVTGIAEVAANIRRLIRSYGDASGNALRAEAELLMTDAKMRTPVDTGALRASGHVTGPLLSGREISVKLGFGGPAAPYAVKVHEDLRAHHDVGQAKFLESVLNEQTSQLPARIAERIRAEVGG